MNLGRGECEEKKGLLRGQKTKDEELELKQIWEEEEEGWEEKKSSPQNGIGGGKQAGGCWVSSLISGFRAPSGVLCATSS